MGLDICIRPADILQAIYNDLRQENKAVRGFQIMHTTDSLEGEEYHKVHIVFDFCSRLSNSGRINLNITRGSKSGAIEAEKDAVVAVIEALRTEHNIFPADYNHIVISESRHVYNGVRSALIEFCNAYDRLEAIVKSCHHSLVDSLKSISSLLGTVDYEAEEVVSFSEYHARMSHFSVQMDLDIGRTRHLVDTALARDIEPEAQRRFDLTVPMPMIINWDTSFSALHAVLDRAKKKLNLKVTSIRVVQLGDGQFDASLDMTIDPDRLYSPNIEEAEAQQYREPVTFSSTPYSSELGAKAKLVYNVLKYVTQKLHRGLIDLNYELLSHQAHFRSTYEDKMKDIFSCGHLLQNVLNTCAAQTRWSNDDLRHTIATTDINSFVFDAVAKFSTEMANYQHDFHAQWNTFLDKKIDIKVVAAIARAKLQ